MTLNPFKWFQKETPVAPPTDHGHPTMAEIGWDNSLIYAPGDFPKFNPDDLIARKGYVIYKKMMRDEQVKYVVNFKKAAILSRGYFFDIDVENPLHQEQSDFFHAMIKNVNGSFTDALKGVLSAINNGFSVTEKNYAPFQWNDRAWWGIRDFKLRPFETFEDGITIDNHGNIKEVRQAQSSSNAILPLDKIIHFVHQPDIDLHYGESDLRACYRSYWSKDIVIRFQNIHLERHASGFIWASLEKSLDDPAKLKLKSLMKNISARMGAYVPKGVKLESIDPKRTDAYEKAVAQHDKGIAKGVLVPNLLGVTEQGSSGSFAQSKINLQGFFWILDEIAKRLADAMNEQVFRQLSTWNFGTEDFPLFVFEPLSNDEKAAIAKAWSELVSKGAVTKTDADEAHTRRFMGYPERSEEDIEAPEDEEEEDEEDDGFDIEAVKDQFSYTDAQIAAIKKTFEHSPWLKRINFADMKNRFEKADNAFTNTTNPTLAAIRASIEDQVIAVVGKKSMANVTPAAIASVVVPPKDLVKLRKAIRANLNIVVNESFDQAKTDLPKKENAVKRIQPGMDLTQSERFLSSRAIKTASDLDNDISKAVQRVLENGIRFDKTLGQIMIDIETDTKLVELLPAIDAAGRAINTPARLETIARTNINDAVNLGRASLFNSPELKGFVQAFEYSAILDDRTTDICNHLDGKILRDFGSFQPPNHFNCRSILVPVTIVDDWNGKESASPRIQPQAGFGG